MRVSKEDRQPSFGLKMLEFGCFWRFSRFGLSVILIRVRNVKQRNDSMKNDYRQNNFFLNKKE
jgi:hypothetical protein